MTAILSVEGVLRKDNKDPIQDGFKLFRTLTVSYRVVLSTYSNLEEIDHWLKTNYVFDYADLMASDSFYEGQDLRTRHIDLVKASDKVELFVDSDADRCAHALSLGIPTLLFSTPAYFKSSREIKPWDSITKEQENQKRRTAENYLKYINGEGIRFE